MNRPSILKVVIPGTSWSMDSETRALWGRYVPSDLGESGP